MCQCLFQTTVLDIPCIVAIYEIDFMSPDPDNDSCREDYEGWLDYAWELRNRRNQRIKWLETKLETPENEIPRRKLQNEMDKAVFSYLTSQEINGL